MNDAISFEEYLNTHDTLTYSNVGTSMLPLLRQGKDIFVVTKKGEEKCKAGEVVLYRRPPDSYVLHRVIKVRADGYVILGDNCISKEYGINDSDIIGIMVGYNRGGNYHSVDYFWYKLYSFYCVHFSWLRIFFKKTNMFIRRILRKLFKKGSQEKQSQDNG